MSAGVSQGIYSLYGRFYDAARFIFQKRLGRAIGNIGFRPGDRVLDIGIGTGLSLAHYPDDVHVTGIDLCPEMLAQARKKVERGDVRRGAQSRTTLLQADALALPFADASFDVVFLSHVISTVPNPHRCLTEALRVARWERSDVLMVNHFRSRLALLGWIETALDPLCRRLGWRSDLSLDELLAPHGVEAPRRRGAFFETVHLHITNGRMRLAVTEPAWMPTVATAR